MASHGQQPESLVGSPIFSDPQRHLLQQRCEPPLRNLTKTSGMIDFSKCAGSRCAFFPPDDSGYRSEKSVSASSLTSLDVDTKTTLASDCSSVIEMMLQL